MKRLVVAVCIGLMGYCGPVNAEIYCQGKIDAALTYSDGRLMVKPVWGDWKVLCNIKEARRGVDPATCFAWYGHVNAAAVEGKDAIIYYPTLSGLCSAVPAYDEAPTPGYVALSRLP